MASYSKPTAPNQPVVISDIAAGDRINMNAVLGKAATYVKVTTSDPTDSVTYRLNNRRNVTQTNFERGSTSLIRRAYDMSKTIEVWDAVTSFTAIAEEFEITGLAIDAIELVSLSLSTGSTITMVVY